MYFCCSFLGVVRESMGDLPHPLTNDYMFKALLQRNKNVLKELVCSLLHLRPEEVESLEIKNPIVLGKAITEDFDSKIFVLDINVLLNNRTLINLEMQVVDYHNWPERTMAYLCRNFDQLRSGEDYVKVKPTIHIGFLDFTLSPEYPEFYATYKMMNVKNHHIYTDKFVLSVVDLKHIGLATQEDREWKLDYWAALFKATTWEELKMLAKESQILKDAVETIYDLTADEAIREQCKAREKHIKEMNTVLKEREIALAKLEQSEQQVDQLLQKNTQLSEENTQQSQRIDQLSEENTQQSRQIDQLSQQNKQLLQEIERLKAHDLTLDEATRAKYQAIEKHIMEKNTVLRERDMVLKETEEIGKKTEEIRKKTERIQKEIAQKEREIERQSQIKKQLQQERDRLKGLQ